VRANVSTMQAMTVRLKHALLVYEDEQTAFVTAHPVSIIKGRPQIGPGAPVSRGALADLARKLAAVTAISGFLPPQLLYLSPRAIAWWRSASPATVFFKCEGDKYVEIGTRSGRTPQPALVFTVAADRWYVHAVKGSGRPSSGTRLHRAPHFNVWHTGEICTGNVNLPDRLDPEVLGDFESAFFGSNFTHANDPKGLTRYKSGATRLWRDLLAGRHKTFPEGSLSAMNITLADFIKKLETGK